MVLAAQVPINSYVGNSSASSFAFTFPVFTQDQILVTVMSAAGVITTLALGTDYSVSGLNSTATPASVGTITLINAGQVWLSGGNLITGYSLSIVRNVALAQLASIRNQGDYDRSFLENALDYIVMAIQQLSQQQTAPVVPASITVVSGDITITGSGSGLILTDQTTSKTYRLYMLNGVLSTQELT